VAEELFKLTKEIERLQKIEQLIASFSSNK